MFNTGFVSLVSDGDLLIMRRYKCPKERKDFIEGWLKGCKGIIKNRVCAIIIEPNYDIELILKNGRNMSQKAYNFQKSKDGKYVLAGKFSHPKTSRISKELISEHYLQNGK